MLADLDLEAGKREAGRRPEAGRGPRCRGRPPGWDLPEEEREREESDVRGVNKHHVVTIKADLVLQSRTSLNISSLRCINVLTNVLYAHLVNKSNVCLSKNVNNFYSAKM